MLILTTEVIMSKQDFNDNFLTKEQQLLNEMSSEDIIYEQTQTGPQEEPFLLETHVDLKKWRKYHQEKMNKKK